jgi:hypothetical protein
VIKKNVFSGRLAVDRAKNGESTDAELRKDINRAEQLGLSEILLELRVIYQTRCGLRAVRNISTSEKKGSARWAFNQLEANPPTSFSWSALTGNGDVVVNLWDDQRDFDPIKFQPQPWVRNPKTKKTGTRTQFFKHLEIAKASKNGLLRVTLSSAIDRDAIPAKRENGKSRPWLNEDGTPVLIKIIELQMPSEKNISGYWRAELAEQHKSPRSPFIFNPIS